MVVQNDIDAELQWDPNGANSGIQSWQTVLTLQNIDLASSPLTAENFWPYRGNTAPTFTTIGETGKLTTDFGGSNDVGRSVTVQTDGDILVAGSSSGYYEGTDFALARYNADGTLDASFAGDGTLTTDFGGSDTGWSVTVQTDGDILVAGSSSSGYYYEGADFALARYNADGALDTSFADGGTLTTDFGGADDFGRSITVQTDGNIVVAGSSGSYYEGYDFALARYNADGTLDTSFAGDGMLTTDFGGADDLGWSVAVQTDGDIVVAGSSGGYYEDHDFALARYNADGTFGDYTSQGEPVLLDNDVRIFDAELADADDYAGSTLTLVRHDGSNADDSFGFGSSARFTVSGNALQADGQTFATFGNSGIEGMLVITFTSSGTPATQALVNDVLQHITYGNISTNPPASVQIDWLFSDGDAAEPLTATASTTVNITPNNNAPQAAPIDLGHADEDSTASRSRQSSCLPAPAMPTATHCISPS